MLRRAVSCPRVSTALEGPDMWVRPTFLNGAIAWLFIASADWWDYGRPKEAVTCPRAVGVCERLWGDPGPSHLRPFAAASGRGTARNGCASSTAAREARSCGSSAMRTYAECWISPLMPHAVLCRVGRGKCCGRWGSSWCVRHNSVAVDVS